VIQKIERMVAYDLYDVLGSLGYGFAPKTRQERAEAFSYKHASWLREIPPASATTLRALAGQFAMEGTDGLENRYVFQVPEVVKAGGLSALQALGQPSDVLTETKRKVFAA
jgi:type I restriction enzyme R subunit